MNKTNPALVSLISELKQAAFKNKAGIWKEVANRLSGPRRNWAAVNVDHLEDILKAGDTAIVPGKILGSGKIAKKVSVAAFSFSSTARKKITDAGGKALTISELVAKNPKGTKVRILE
jgi:large subunit ribosomal protein L18e